MTVLVVPSAKGLRMLARKPVNGSCTVTLGVHVICTLFPLPPPRTPGVPYPPPTDLQYGHTQYAYCNMGARLLPL